jgi:hypothetical protein
VSDVDPGIAADADGRTDFPSSRRLTAPVGLTRSLAGNLLSRLSTVARSDTRRPAVCSTHSGVVVYEMLTGERPAAGGLVPPSRLRRDWPEDRDPALLRCLDRSPERRSRRAGEAIDGLAAIEASRRVVLGEVVNRSGEPRFDGVLGHALRVALEQSPRVRVLSPESMRQVLRRMQRDPATAIDRETGAELGLREGAGALILASFDEIGARYLLSALRELDQVAARRRHR